MKQMKSRLKSFWAAGTAALVVGAVGAVGLHSAYGADAEVAPAASGESGAQVSFVRLTTEEYRRTIRDVFGPTIRMVDNKVEPGFRDEGLLALGTRKLTVGSAELERDEELAQDIATQVVDPRRRATLVHCEPRSETAADDACAKSFISRVGLYLFRRPLTGEELARYVGTQNAAASRLKSFNAGLSAAVAQMLVDPEFLFRIERTVAPESLKKVKGAVVAEGNAPMLDAYSRASRLSFFLWDAPPDAQLLEAARTGKILTQAGLNEQVERLLSSSRVEDGLRAFFVDMLGFDGFQTLTVDTNLYPRFTKNVQEDAQEQTLRTIVDQLLDKNKAYGDLFTTKETFLTPSLAALYGVPLPRSQELGGAVPWVPYTFAQDDPHVGILSQVSFLSLNSHPGRTSPTLRGKAVREKLLCQKVPPPPGNVDFSIVQDTNNPSFKTVRQRLTAHRKDAMCAGCHKITDPMGLSLENFDTASEYRTNEAGAPIDASGDLNGKPFNGLKELAQVLKDNPGTNACLISRAYSYGTERKPTELERKWLTDLQGELTKEGGVRWRDLMRRISLNPQFYTVPVAAPLSAQAH